MELVRLAVLKYCLSHNLYVATLTQLMKIQSVLSVL
jgi:hypothetical protein